MEYALIIFLLILAYIQTENNQFTSYLEESIETYNKLNNFETVLVSKNFIINTTQKSYAYFDSFDNSAIFWISKNYSDFINGKDQRITGKFYPIEPNTTYYVRNFIWTYPSVLEKYLYPADIDKDEIIINDDIEEINFLFLEANKTYILNFEENKYKKMIKLSHKTLNSKVKIIINEIEETELNENEHFYKISEDFKGKIQLEIYEDNAMIEFLSDRGSYKVFTEISYEKNKVENDILIINIQKTQKCLHLL